MENDTKGHTVKEVWKRVLLVLLDFEAYCLVLATTEHAADAIDILTKIKTKPNQNRTPHKN